MAVSHLFFVLNCAFSGPKGKKLLCTFVAARQTKTIKFTTLWVTQVIILRVFFLFFGSQFSRFPNRAWARLGPGLGWARPGWIWLGLGWTGLGLGRAGVFLMY